MRRNLLAGLVTLAIFFSRPGLLPGQQMGRVVLVGDNSPHAPVNDGDFNVVSSTWRQAKQSPYWTTRHVQGMGDKPIGIHEGKMFTRNARGIIESRVLDNNPEYPNLKAGDVLHWSFGVDSEYRCGAEASFSLVFGEHERMLADRVPIRGGNRETEVHTGTYVVTSEDAEGGMPFVRVSLFAREDVRTYLDFVNLAVEVPEKTGPQILLAEEKDGGIQLSWEDSLKVDGDWWGIYRKEGEARKYFLLAEIKDSLRTDLWGAEGVLPRDPSNGIEHPDWSYWGGRPVKDKDGRFHMLVTRWPANATKGHWDWPNSTVAYTVSDQPTGPYEVVDDLAYTYSGGLGHNPDIILLNDGTYMLYSLIDWEATLFASGSMAGPWKRLGTMVVNDTTSGEDPGLWYRHYRNLSGLQLEDGRFLFVTKAGAMMISEGRDPLGPYQLLTSPVRGNETIPEKYRYSNYEDPVIWRDEVQFHMLINAFWDFRAIYLRSPDGIHWKFDPGVAYDPGVTSWEDGTRNHWYKLERPHVIQDEYGRATHLSLAVLDVPKAEDRSGDRHNSKNIIIPLQVHRRLLLLNKKRPEPGNRKIKLFIRSEPGFDAAEDVDPLLLRFGASETVNLGGGCEPLRWKKKGDDLLVIFDAKGHGIAEDDFAGKLLGKTRGGELVVGFSKLK